LGLFPIACDPSLLAEQWARDSLATRGSPVVVVVVRLRGWLAAPRLRHLNCLGANLEFARLALGLSGEQEALLPEKNTRFLPAPLVGW
jgi:hypothetical protein